MAIEPAGSRWGRKVVGFLWMARTLVWTTSNTWIFVTTIANGRDARSAVADFFALTISNGRSARSAVAAAFALTIADGLCAMSAVGVAFALTVASGTDVQCARLKPGNIRDEMPPLLRCRNGRFTHCVLPPPKLSMILPQSGGMLAESSATTVTMRVF